MEWVLEQQPVDENFSNKIFFSNEAYFTLGGYANKQNCRVWGFENPYVTKERSLHPENVSVWWTFWSEGVIGWDTAQYMLKDGRKLSQYTSRDGHLNGVVLHT